MNGNNISAATSSSSSTLTTADISDLLNNINPASVDWSKYVISNNDYTSTWSSNTIYDGNYGSTYVSHVDRDIVLDQEKQKYIWSGNRSKIQKVLDDHYLIVEKTNFDEIKKNIEIRDYNILEVLPGCISFNGDFSILLKTNPDAWPFEFKILAITTGFLDDYNTMILISPECPEYYKVHNEDIVDPLKEIITIIQNNISNIKEDTWYGSGDSCSSVSSGGISSYSSGGISSITQNYKVSSC